jgi:hypothetical protein
MSTDRFNVLERFESLFEAPEPSFESFLRRRQRKQRNQRIAAGVVGFAVLVALLVSLATVLPADHTQAPADTVPTAPPPRRGFIGLPPEGAPPSTPESGELVASIWSHASAGTDAWFYVYADGRLIWQRYTEPATGWLEQRLTPEGVELVRAEIISTGLFDPDHPPAGSELGLDFPLYGDVQVRNGDRLVYVPRRPGEEWTGEFDRLHERLRNLHSWLPTSAWDDREISGYVPSTFAICLSNTTGRLTDLPPIEPSSILSLLPAAAEELLGSARHWQWRDLAEDPGSVRAFGSSRPHCFDVTTEQARALADALDAAGIEHGSPGTLIFRFDAPDPISRTVDILFLPHLPHGVPATTGG